MNYINLMIIAHPDDELFFGWKELFNNDNNWLIVCLTNKKNTERSAKFKKVINLLGKSYIMFDNTDIWNNLEWNNDVQNNIEKKMNKILNKNLCIEKIITHNPDGEYGHYHHKITSKIITNLLNKRNEINKLYYFYFDNNKYEKLSEKFHNYLKIYFEDPYNDDTILGHLKLSEICTIIQENNYKKESKYIKDFYPEWFLKTDLITFEKYL